ncbi:MAG: hypothetical protein ACRDQZ_09115 [Mycobacteriales bacterium]
MSPATMEDVTKSEMILCAVTGVTVGMQADALAVEVVLAASITFALIMAIFLMKNPSLFL